MWGSKFISTTPNRDHSPTIIPSQKSPAAMVAAMFMLSLVDIVMVTWGRNQSIVADLLLA